MSTKMRKLKGEDVFTCETCNKVKDDFYLYTDNYYHKTICETCYNKQFAIELKSKNKAWFEGNLNKEDYPPEFWNQFEEKTKVTFRKEKGDVCAVFPGLIADRKGNLTCYAHIGQHSACHPSYYKHLRKATKEEYADLKNELEQIGYNLEVL